MKHPYNLPHRLLNYCESVDQFFLDEIGTLRRNFQFKIYLQTLLYRHSDDPYDRMFRAALDQDLVSLSGLAKQNNLAEIPVFAQPLSDLLTDASSFDEAPLISLLLAPNHIKQGRMTQPKLHSLLEDYPEHQENLLKLAYLLGSPVDWELILDQQKFGGLACLALSKKVINSKELAGDLYSRNPTLLNFYCWLLLSRDKALAALPHHPHPSEIIKLIVLHGDSALLLKYSPILATLEYNEVMQALQLFFGVNLKTRPGLAVDESDRFDVADPVFIKNLLLKRPPAGRSRALIQKMIQHCSGEAMIYFKLREKICL